MQLFVDGFESGGLAAWTAAIASGSGTSVGVTGAAALVGAQGLRTQHDDAGDQNYEARITTLLSPPTTGRLYAEGIFRLTSVAAVGYGAAGSKAILAVRATDGQEQAWLSLRAGGLRFSYRSRSGNVVSVNSNIPVPSNMPRRFRLLVDRAGASPIVTAWMSDDNGATWSQLGTATDVTAGVQGVGKSSGRVDVGIVHITNFEPGTYTIDVDDIVVADSVGATDWQALNAAIQPVQFAFRAMTDYPSSATVDIRAQTAQEGLKTAESTTEAGFDVSGVSGASVEHPGAPATIIALESESDVLQEAFATAVQAMLLEQATAVNVEHETAVAVTMGMRTKAHAVMGELGQATRMTGGDAAWGTASGADSRE